jgi:hypothetical protein
MKIQPQQYHPIALSENEVKVIVIWRHFNRVQAIGDNRENCTLELSEDGYGWVSHLTNGDYLEFPCGTREVTWDSFDRGIEVLTEYLQDVGEKYW